MSTIGCARILDLIQNGRALAEQPSGLLQLL
jgi:hypothetical protein